MHVEDIAYEADDARLLGQFAADDPIIPPERRAAFEKEMKEAGCDWRLQLHGSVGHSFTNPSIDARGLKGDQRSLNAMVELFNETLK